MPIVTIQITREGTTPGATATTPEEKAALIKGASELMRDVLGKPLEATFVVIEEVELGNWGWGGLPVPEYRRQLAAKAGQPAGADSGEKRLWDALESIN